jgi:hypothetical protein
MASQDTAVQLQQFSHGPSILRRFVSGVKWRDALVRLRLDAGKIAYVGLWDLYASGVLIPEVDIESPYLDQRSPLYMNVEPRWRMQRTTSVR